MSGPREKIFEVTPSRTVVSNSICLGPLEAVLGCYRAARSPLLKTTFDGLQGMDVTATFDCREGCYWENEVGKEAWGRSPQKNFS